MGIPAQAVQIQSHQVKELHNAGLHIHPPLHPVYLKGFHQNLAYSPPGIQAGGRVLEYNLDLPAHFL